MQADRLVAISQFTADECIRLLGAPAAKFTVTPLASDFGDPEVPMTERPPDTPVPADFLLFVGSLEPVKNLALLRDVYAAARTRGASLPPLIIVGSRWQQVPGEGPPPPAGHGRGSQPVLEAMTLGCPVVCSPVASLPEVGGDAAWYVPHHVDAYLDALHQLAANASLRESFRAQGLRQAAKFSWNACAQQTLAVYHQAIESHTV
jgi:alpha-1,3-rhamnosyl/mannosyltransferase